MVITNTTKQSQVADNCDVAKSFFRRFLGLMGKKSLPSDSGLFICPCKSIHMFFMRIPLDIIFIDDSNLVIHLIEDIKPWRISKYVRGASGVIELPVGTIKKSKTSVGDKLSFI